MTNLGERKNSRMIQPRIAAWTPLITAHILQCLCALESLRSWPLAKKTETAPERTSARCQLEFSDEYRSKAVWYV